MKKNLLSLVLTGFFFLSFVFLSPSIINARNAEESVHRIYTMFDDDTCEIKTLPYTENFDNFSSFPGCWKTAGGTKPTFNINVNNSKSLPNSITMSSTNGNCILVFPALSQGIEAKDVLVKYNFKANRIDCILEIGVMTDPADATTFEPLDKAVNMVANQWGEQVAYLNNYTGNGKFIAFKVANNSISNFLDDIRLEILPDCFPVENLKTAGIGTNAISLNWEIRDKEINDFIVKYKVKGSSSWIDTKDVTGTSTFINGLTSGETYIFEVSSICTEFASDPKEIEVKTVCYPSGDDCLTSFCMAPNIVRATNITTTTADISWVLEGDASSFEMEYKTSSSSIWINEDGVFGNNHTLANLLPATTYNVRMKTVCGISSSTNWKEINFTTPAESIVCEIINTLPYVEKFDTYFSTGVYLECWERFTTAINQPATTIISGTYNSGTTGLSFPTASQAYNMAILPKIDDLISISDLEMTFSIKTRDTSMGRFIVGVLEDPNYVYSFEPVDTARATLYYVWESTIISFKNYTGNGKYIALMWKNSSSAFLVDDIEIRYNSSLCVTPTDFAIDNITPNSVAFSWTDEKNSNWKVACMPGDAPAVWSNAQSFTAITTGTINGLLPATKYTLHLIADCDGETSRTVTLSFTTACEEIGAGTLPYMELFDTYGTWNYATSFPTCWSRLSSTAPFIAGTHYYSSPGGLFFDYRETSLDPLVAITGKINSNVSNLLLTFKLRGSISNYNFAVGVMTDPTDISTFTLVDTVFVENSNSWEDKVVSFKQYQGLGQYIAFKAGSPEFGTCSFWMDNVIINDVGDCAAPDVIKIATVTSSEASISWRENGDATRWIIAYGVLGFNPNNNEGDTVSSLENRYIIPNLISNTDYEVYIKADCGDGNLSMWSLLSATFKTKLHAIIPPYFCDFEDDYESETWGLINANQTNQWYYGTATNNGGTKALYISNDNGVNNEYTVNSPSYVYAVKTFFFNYQGTYEIDFDWKANGYSHQDLLRVFIVPDIVVLHAGDANGMPMAINNTPEGWIAIDKEPLSGRNTWQHIHSKINVTNIGFYNLVFFWKNSNSNAGSQSPAAIDNVSVIFISCPEPEDITAKITATTATVQWKEVRIAENWEIQYGQEGFALGTGTSVYPTENTTYEITGLSPNTSYDLYVRSLCSVGDTSVWSKKLSFTTLCQIASTQLPHFENFDSYTGDVIIPNTKRDVIPTCWFASKTGTSAFPYIANWGTNSYISSPYALDFGYTTGSYNLAIMPEMSPDIDINSLKLSFWVKTQNGPGVFSIGLIDEPLADSTFSVIESWQGITNQWKLFTTYLTDFVGTGKHLAFKWEGGTYNSLSLDDVTISLITASDTCTRPHDLLVSNVAVESADVSWSAGNATSWEIAYKEASESAYSTPVVCNSANHSLTDLIGETDYDVRIRTTCDDGKTSVWVVSHFTTAEIPHVYTITPTAGANGTTSPSEAVSINRGNDTTFTFIPDQGYEVEQVIINNVAQGAISSYRFTNVQENYTIYVSFKAAEVIPDSVTITATTGLHGTISPIGVVKIAKGEDQTFVFTPDSLYKVKFVKLNGDSVDYRTTYTMTNVQNDATIHVEFESTNIGIPQYLLDQTVLVYPNPVQDYVKVRLNTAFEQIEITNLLGQVIYNAIVNASEFEIKTTDYKSGIYFIRLQGEQGVVTKKFVKE